MRLSIIVDFDAVAERRALPLAPQAGHRAPPFPLATFLTHLAASYLPCARTNIAAVQADAASGAYLPPARPHVRLINRSA